MTEIQCPKLIIHLLHAHLYPPPLLSVSLATGAAPPVGVATVHRHGAENGGDKEAFQAQER